MMVRMKTLFLYLIPLLMYASHRTIFIFYNSAGEILRAKQMDELQKDSAGLQDRDLTIHLINTATANSSIQKWHIDTTQPFTFILVGKDETEKLRSATPVSREKLFAVIDAMPMRRAEMRNN